MSLPLRLFHGPYLRKTDTDSLLIAAARIVSKSPDHGRNHFPFDSFGIRNVSGSDEGLRTATTLPGHEADACVLILTAHPGFEIAAG